MTIAPKRSTRSKTAGYGTGEGLVDQQLPAPVAKRPRRAKPLLVATEAAPAKQPRHAKAGLPQQAVAKTKADMSPDEAAIEMVRDHRRKFVKLLHKLGNTPAKAGMTGPFGSSDLTLALRHMQDAETRAIRHIAGWAD